MPTYVDGFVLPVPKKKLDAYRSQARLASKIWREHGALDYRECVADDIEGPHGRPFSKIVKPKDDETIVFAWITYKSRAHRDRVNAKVMDDPRLAPLMKEDAMPFDVRRMSHGGFKTIVGT